MSILLGDCRETLKTIESDSISSIVTDPPYQIGFMGKGWDSTGIANDPELWAECYRVLKPGGYLLAFGATRTYHRMACAIEDAGFEIRDSIHWLYGSGFPKSHKVSKGIDEAAGAIREIVPSTRHGGGSSDIFLERNNQYKTVGISKWEGWGTALKPAHEPIVVARKPFAGTVANNVLEHGTGALNIDGCRVAGVLEGDPNRFTKTDGGWFSSNRQFAFVVHSNGRWPANVIIDSTSPAAEEEWAKYFYSPKASKAERNLGLDGFPAVTAPTMYKGIGGNKGPDYEMGPKQNHHPTVKPLALMRYLVRLVTPPGGIVLDPFLGSGTTAMAAILEGHEWIGCEMTLEYLPLIEARTRWAYDNLDPIPDPTLFDFLESI